MSENVNTGNRVRTTTTIDSSKERIRDTVILNRELLYVKDLEDLYIKYANELVPIGGHLKQNYLEAGDNIEILREDEDHNPRLPEEIRLKDDIDVNTVTLSPDGNSTLNWKGTIKIGELHNRNKLFLLTKQSDVNVPDKSIIGGELLIKYFTNLDENEHYGHYALTCSSTGSWSLKGATQEILDVRMCKMRKLDNDDYYYGLKLPAGPFKDTRVEEVKTFSTATIRGSLGLRVGSAVNFLYLYSGNNQIGLAKGEHLNNYTVNGNEYSRDVWYAPLDNLVTVLGWDAHKTVLQYEDTESNLIDILNKGYFIGLTLDTREANTSSWRIYATSNSVSLRKTGLNTNWQGQLTNANQATATYTLYRGNTSYQLSEIGTDTNLYGSGASNYNHWYVMPMTNFFTLTGINPQGEWRQYNNNNYRFAMRIYTKGLDTRITLVAIMRSNSAEQIKTITANDENIEFNWDSELVNLRTDNPYTAMNNNASTELFKFIDRVETPSKSGLQINAVNLQVLDTDKEPLNYTLDFTRFNQAYIVDHYNEVSNFSNNRIAIFRDDGSEAPILLPADQASSDNEQTSWLGTLTESYRYVSNRSYNTIEFVNEIFIEDAEFWFNGWRHLPVDLDLQDYTDNDFDYVVLADKSNDNDSFAETFYDIPARDIASKITTLQMTGEDNAPYRFIVTGTITMSDLRAIANVCRDPNRQIYLDMSGATVASDARNWNNQLFSGCVSLRGFIMPRGVATISDACFIWCTYLRELDLSPSAGTLTNVGAASSWSPAVGLLTSTRVRNLLVPASVNTISKYFVGSSCNIRNLIFLHQNQNPISVDQWSFVLTNNNNNISSESLRLPDNFHCFVAESWYNGYLRSQFWNNSGMQYQWNTSQGWWTNTMVSSMVRFNPGMSQQDWQDFADDYEWDEDLVNTVRAAFGYTTPIEIKSKTDY